MIHSRSHRDLRVSGFQGFKFFSTRICVCEMHVSFKCTRHAKRLKLVPRNTPVLNSRELHWSTWCCYKSESYISKWNDACRIRLRSALLNYVICNRTACKNSTIPLISEVAQKNLYRIVSFNPTNQNLLIHITHLQPNLILIIDSTTHLSTQIIPQHPHQFIPMSLNILAWNCQG